NVYYPFFCACLTKGKGRGGGKGKYRKRIALLYAVAHLPYNSLVTGHFHVSRKETVCQPDKGVEPVYAQGKIENQLAYVVVPLYVSLFVQQDIFLFIALKSFGKADDGAEKSHYKGCREIAAYEGIAAFFRTDFYRAVEIEV